MRVATAFILGGGRSAQEIDLKSMQLHGPIWGVNEAAFNYPCDAFFTIDRVWMWLPETQEQVAKLTCPVHYAAKSYQKWPVMPANAVKWERVLGAPSFIMPKVATGHQSAASSGLSCINALAQYGYNRIYLFGFDMHAHYDYWFSNKTHPKDNIPKVLENFRFHAPYYRAGNIQIYNVNPDSAIDAFPRISVGEMQL